MNYGNQGWLAGALIPVWDILIRRSFVDLGFVTWVGCFDDILQRRLHYHLHRTQFFWGWSTLAESSDCLKWKFGDALYCNMPKNFPPLLVDFVLNFFCLIQRVTGCNRLLHRLPLIIILGLAEHTVLTRGRMRRALPIYSRLTRHMIRSRRL